MNTTRSSEGAREPQVRCIGASDGDLLALLGAVTRIRVSSRETLGTFFVGEAKLPPHAFVPLHYHPDVEVNELLRRKFRFSNPHTNPERRCHWAPFAARAR